MVGDELVNNVDPVRLHEVVKTEVVVDNRKTIAVEGGDLRKGLVPVAELKVLLWTKQCD